MLLIYITRFLISVKPDPRDLVDLRSNATEKRRPGRPPKVAQEEISLEAGRATKRARQSTLSFVTPGDRIYE
jgi:hypothetical protein